MELARRTNLNPMRRRLLSRFRLFRPRITVREMTEVLGHYDLGQWKAVRTLEGRNSCNVVLETSAGTKVLKRYHGSLAKTLVEHFVIDHLSETDFPCPRLERNDQGLTYYQSGRQHYAIYEYIDGRPWSSCAADPALKEHAVKSSARTLARLDVALNAIPQRDLPAELSVSKTLWPGDLAEHLNTLDQYTAMVCRSIRNRDLRDERTRLLGEIREDVENAWDYYQQNDPKLPKQVVHYDYAPKNLMFGDGKVIAVLDFGEVCNDFRASDVARGITSFAGKVGYEMDWPTVGKFLQAYQSEQVLYRKEIDSIPDLIRWRVFKRILSIMEISLKTGNRPDRVGFYHDPETFIGKKWEYIAWLKERREDYRLCLAEAARS